MNAISLTRQFLNGTKLVPFAYVVCSNLMGLDLSKAGANATVDAISGTLGWACTLCVLDFIYDSSLVRFYCNLLCILLIILIILCHDNHTTW